MPMTIGWWWWCTFRNNDIHTKKLSFRCCCCCCCCVFFIVFLCHSLINIGYRCNATWNSETKIALGNSKQRDQENLQAWCFSFVCEYGLYLSAYLHTLYIGVLQQISKFIAPYQFEVRSVFSTWYIIMLAYADCIEDIWERMHANLLKKYAFFSPFFFFLMW